MPFTPFHLGPGLALKAVAGERFSLLAFGVAQVAMDLEPLVGILSGSDVLHGTSHTYLAAIPIGLAAAAITPVLCRPLLKGWNLLLRNYRLDRLPGTNTFDKPALVFGALAGTLSHVALDSLMHHDIRPLAPFSTANGLLGVVPLDALHLACVAAGVAGFVLWTLRARRSSSQTG
jgi:hypothetical protein